jgi:hypothetical protein
MSSVTSEHWQLVRRLLVGEISNSDFCDLLSTTVDNASDVSIEVLRNGFLQKDAAAVEFGLFIGHRFGIKAQHLDILLELANADWHQQHEDVVSGLDLLRCPLSIDVLYQLALAKFDYLDFDEAFALGVKAIWALGNIGTTHAAARLTAILSCGNSVLVENAANQLDRIAALSRPKV